MNLNITAAQLRELDPGQSIAQVVRLASPDDQKEAIRSALKQMSMNISNKVGRAKTALDGSDYTMETFVTRTASLDTLAGVVVTRTA